MEDQEEITLVDMTISVEQNLQPHNHYLEPIEECNLDSQEESIRVAYDKLIYGVGFMVVPSKFAEDYVNKPQVQLSNLLLGLLSTCSCSLFKRNSRSSSFVVEETDVGQEWGKFRHNILKVWKRKTIKKIEAKIGNSRIMRLFAAGIFKNMIYWTFRVTKLQILIYKSNWNRF